MAYHPTGCLICGESLTFYDAARTLTCAFCGQSFEANAVCPDEHYVCDRCHARKGFEIITECAMNAEGKNPFTIASEAMRSPFIHMHGPEHHYLVAAALLTAYRNAGGDVDLEAHLSKARQRAANVPGGICGLWGSCGAAIGSGIFISVITGATGVSEREWSMANQMTSRSLLSISENGGPRCCKRNTYLALTNAVEFVQEHMRIQMDTPDQTKCSHFTKNKQCKESACLYWPGETDKP